MNVLIRLAFELETSISQSSTLAPTLRGLPQLNLWVDQFSNSTYSWVYKVFNIIHILFPSVACIDSRSSYLYIYIYRSLSMLAWRRGFESMLIFSFIRSHEHGSVFGEWTAHFLDRFYPQCCVKEGSRRETAIFGTRLNRGSWYTSQNGHQKSQTIFTKKKD